MNIQYYDIDNAMHELLNRDIISQSETSSFAHDKSYTVNPQYMILAEDSDGVKFEVLSIIDNLLISNRYPLTFDEIKSLFVFELSLEFKK
jgi:hypothetical protein